MEVVADVWNQRMPNEIDAMVHDPGYFLVRLRSRKNSTCPAPPRDTASSHAPRKSNSLAGFYSSLPTSQSVPY